MDGDDQPPPLPLDQELMSRRVDPVNIPFLCGFLDAQAQKSPNGDLFEHRDYFEQTHPIINEPPDR